MCNLNLLGLVVVAFWCGVTAVAQYPVSEETFIKASPSANGAQFGIASARSGSTVVIGALDDSSGGGVFGGAVYVFEVVDGTWTQQAKVAPTSPRNGDRFGFSVDIDDDTMIVGALFQDSASTGVDGIQTDTGAGSSGAAYVFVRNGNAWTQQAYLKASNTESGDGFGVSVAVEGDLVAVGAFHEDSVAVGVDGDPLNNFSANSGAVYLYRRSAGVWTPEAYLKSDFNHTGTEFGFALDVDQGIVAVGAPVEYGGTTGVNGDTTLQTGPGSGAVYFFEHIGGAWAQTTYFKASNVAVGAEFGSYISLSVPYMCVGAPNDRAIETGLWGAGPGLGFALSNKAGAAYVFKRTGGVWAEDLYVKPANGHLEQLFGYTCSISPEGDILAVGAHGDSSPGFGVIPPPVVTWTWNPPMESEYSGAVFVYRKIAGVWVDAAYIKASNSDALDGFGRTVLLHGDHLIVGSPGEASVSSGVGGSQGNGAFRVGALYDFDLDGPDAATFIRTQGSNPMAYSSTLPQIGTSIALTVDLATSGHAAALLTCFKRPASIGPFLNGQWILAGPHFPAGEIFGLAPLAGGPSVSASIAIPDAPILVGEVLHTQAFLFGGGLNWSASNAIRLTLGN